MHRNNDWHTATSMTEEDCEHFKEVLRNYDQPISFEEYTPLAGYLTKQTFENGLEFLEHCEFTPIPGLTEEIIEENEDFQLVFSGVNIFKIALEHIFEAQNDEFEKNIEQLS